MAHATITSRLSRPRTASLRFAIGSQGRGALASPVPHPPFNPYVRFSRIRLTDDLLGMGLRRPRISDGATQPVQAQPVEPVLVPLLGLTGAKVATTLLDHQ